EAVILRGNLHSLSPVIEHRLVGAAMAKFQLERLRPVGQAEKLMAQADAENRFLAAQFANGFDAIANSRGISWSVRQENAIRTVGEYLRRAGRSRNDRNPAADLDQAAENVPFHSEIDGHDMMRRRSQR